VRVTAIGGDPALLHGVFVLATWNLSKKPKLIEYKILYSWTKKDPHLSEKSTQAGIKRACQAIVGACRDVTEPHPVGIDWTAYTGFMGRRLTAAILSFFMGYLTREFELYGFPVIMVSPAEVREQMGIPHNAPKEDVWHELRAMLDASQVKMRKSQASDLRDALVLSYLTAVGRSRHEAGQGLASHLSSG